MPFHQVADKLPQSSGQVEEHCRDKNVKVDYTNITCSTNVVPATNFALFHKLFYIDFFCFFVF